MIAQMTGTEHSARSVLPIIIGIGAVNEQVEIWKNESKEFEIAHGTDNLYDEGRLGNMYNQDCIW